MTYPNPPHIFQGPFSVENGSAKTTLRSSDQFLLEVESLGELGWLLELRHDQIIDSFKRQIFTANQEALPRELLHANCDGNDVVITSQKDRISIRADGSIQIQCGNDVVFDSPFSFSVHRKAVMIYENLMSSKVTDFSNRAPFSPRGKTFSTHMVRFQYPRPDGVVFGLPGQTGELNRNGYRFELYNTDEFLHIPLRKPMYQSWPILIHRAADRRGWIAIFHDNPSRTFVDVGDFFEDRITFESINGNSRVFIIPGSSLEEVSHRVSKLLGGSVFPPLWAFGYQQCRWSYMNSQEVRSVVKKFRESNIPLDAIYLDIDYMDGFRVFTINRSSFPDMEKLNQELKEDGIRSVCIIDPGVKIDPHYPVYEKVKKSDAFLKTENGEPFIAKVWPGETLLPDFGDARTIDLWSNLQAEWLINNNFDGVWNDMNEPSNFDGANETTSKAVTTRGPLNNEYNLYGYYMAAASNCGWKKAFPERRGVIITRSGYPGVQQNAVIWHGDNMAWWEHLRLAIDTCISYSLLGAHYTGPDVPGFTGNPPEDLAVRFFQLGAFLPLFRGHSIYFAKDKEPFAFSKQATDIIRSAIQLRYSLLREWYSGFEQSRRNHTPLIKPILTRTNEVVRDQFILFNKFLVAPIVERDQSQRLIYLPPGCWYRLGNTTQRIAGDTWLSISVTLEDIPVYVRAGSIVVKNSPGKNVTETFARPEQFEIYPSEDGNGVGYWYSDDGEAESAASAISKQLTWDSSRERISGLP